MLEVERYELRAGPTYHFDLDRRDFFKLLGGGLVLLLAIDPKPSRRNPDAAAEGKDCPTISVRGCTSAKTAR